MASEAVAIEDASHGHLRRELRFWEAIAISIGIMAPTAAMALNGVAPAGLRPARRPRLIEVRRCRTVEAADRGDASSARFLLPSVRPVSSVRKTWFAEVNGLRKSLRECRAGCLMCRESSVATTPPGLFMDTRNSNRSYNGLKRGS